MSVRQRVRSKKHRRAALDSEDDDGNGYGEYDQEQQQRRANVAPQHRRLRQSEALRYEDEGDDSDVKIEPVAYPVHSKSSSRQRKKQSRESSSNSHTSSPVKKKSRRPMPIAVTGPMFQHEAMMATASSIAASPRVLPVMLTIGDWLGTNPYYSWLIVIASNASALLYACQYTNALYAYACRCDGLRGRLERRPGAEHPVE